METRSSCSIRDIENAIEEIDQIEERRICFNYRYCLKKKITYPLLIYASLLFQLYVIIYTLCKYNEHINNVNELVGEKDSYYIW